MAKLIMLVCIALLIGAVISAIPERSYSGRSALRTTPRPVVGPTCGRHGDPCNTVGGCCSGTRCHPYAGRCQVIITAQDLQNQRQNLRPVQRPRNY